MFRLSVPAWEEPLRQDRDESPRHRVHRPLITRAADQAGFGDNDAQSADRTRPRGRGGVRNGLRRHRYQPWPIDRKPLQVSSGAVPTAVAIVLNYNYGRYLGDCLESISAQSYRDLRAIVVDDASSDHSTR